jgi:hypothetical protein
MKGRILFFAVILCIPVLLFSNPVDLKKNIIWQSNTRIALDEFTTQKVLNFNGAFHEPENGFLPMFNENIPISAFDKNFKLSIRNSIYETINANELEGIEHLDMISSLINEQSQLIIIDKDPYVSLKLIPVRKNELTGFFERLVSFTVRLEWDEMAGSQLKSGNYVDNSVLAEGNWFKVAVVEDGIYKVTYDELSSMGMDVGSIDPKNLRVYGNGGGMLSESTTQFYFDDLQENAIYVEGEQDGSFDGGDYVLFYAQSPHTWKFDNVNYTKEIHLYSDQNFYFINADLGPGKRIDKQFSTTQEPTDIVTTFTEGIHHELEEKNLVKSGRQWFGEEFDIYTEVSLDYSISNLDLNTKAWFKGQSAAHSFSPSTFKYYINNEEILSYSIPQVSTNVNSTYANARWDSVYFNLTVPDFTVKIVYNKPQQSSIGWLDFFTLNINRKLRFTSGQMPFRNIKSVGLGKIAEYRLANANQQIKIWNVSDARNVREVVSNFQNDFQIFRLQTDSLHEFVAFDGTSYKSVSYVEKVGNQDLHAFGQTDMLIVSPPLFFDEANRLAQHHIDFDNMSVRVVDPMKIYNEFSSGMQDISAIRNFLKLLYEKSDLKYVLFFGDGSYDNKNRIEENTNFIPTWQSLNSTHPINSYVTDDFYGFLDHLTGDQTIDIGIGRFVVTTLEQAKNAVDKSIHYAINTPQVMGDWRNVICLVGDDGDGNLHLRDAEELATQIDSTNKNINIDKIYLDAYKQVSTPSGERYPDATRDINNRIERGTLVINYVGHGGEAGWAHERVLEIADINSWKNFDNLAVFFTATCEFSRFDDPERVSAGELVFLNPNGGGISLFTTIRATYASSNRAFNQALNFYSLQRFDGEYLRMGDVIKKAKIRSGSNDNGRKYILLGDPALKIAFPEHNVITATINGIDINEGIDTISALSEVTISGDIRDIEGNKLEAYDGHLFPIVFDKPSRILTLGNDPESYPTEFFIQKNNLYKGKASINDGEWSFTFVAPKDIAYQYGYGKLSYYTKSETEDGAGYFTDIVVGGYNQNASEDYTGPEIRLFINDTTFKRGGMTDENPSMLAYVYDESGINTVGNGIGHDLVALMDDKDSYIVNDYYESALDDYRYGSIKYPFHDLKAGSHQLSFRVWDVHNNSSIAYTDFIVATSEEMVIEHLLTYPNPFKDHTTFVFDHNQADKSLTIKIEIYSLQGQLVKILEERTFTSGYHYESTPWPGTDGGGNKLLNGMYVYKVIVRNSEGKTAHATEKLVILK